MIEPKIGDVWRSPNTKIIILDILENRIKYRWEGTAIKGWGVSDVRDFSYYTLLERDGKPYEHVPQGEELIGYLCAVTNIKTTAELKVSAENLSGHMGIITVFSGSCYEAGNITWRRAYPIKINGQYVKVDMKGTL